MALYKRKKFKDECTHYEHDFGFWRNLIIGLIVTTTVTYNAIELYYYLNPSEIDLMREEFEKLKDN